MHTQVKVWDWSLRVFHWSLPILLFLLWFSATQSSSFDRLEHHMILAQILMGLVIYRIIWGFIGTPAARFSRFLYGPGRIGRYAQSLLQRQPQHYLSHNPMGGLMVLVLLGVLAFQLLTGLFTTDDILFDGPLVAGTARETVRWMSGWHRTFFFDWILPLIALHLFAILLHKLLGEGLVKAMFTGRKPHTPHTQDAQNLCPESAAFPWARFGLAVILAVAPVVYIFHLS
ncbi:cytochrome b/b6 domain-containing protein [Nitrincola tapanii]|uniref:Cytochrome B n=1 Tax=Nitrincola tapanii TaxID=1708751 RepID=A0A5A9W446_9GAMM|nr:cytochrome b/b6 domain-containing protein [Nitrincola tapanii]KAA0874321.1 cytochrome B [Nitrincola tapanii]